MRNLILSLFLILNFVAFPLIQASDLENEKNLNVASAIVTPKQIIPIQGISQEFRMQEDIKDREYIDQLSSSSGVENLQRQLDGHFEPIPYQNYAHTGLLSISHKEVAPGHKEAAPRKTIIKLMDRRNIESAEKVKINLIKKFEDLVIYILIEEQQLPSFKRSISSESGSLKEIAKSRAKMKNTLASFGAIEI